MFKGAESPVWNGKRKIAYSVFHLTSLCWVIFLVLPCALFSCFIYSFSPSAGLLLWHSGLFAMLRLLPQDKAVHWHTLHVRTVLHAGHRHLRRHDVTDRGKGDAGTCKSRRWPTSLSPCLLGQVSACSALTHPLYKHVP